MLQIARNAMDKTDGSLRGLRFALHDRDSKFSSSFQNILMSGGEMPLRLPPRSPDLKASAERWVRSVKAECLSKLILFGESSLRRAITEYLDHYHHERNHQGKRNLLLFPIPPQHRNRAREALRCHERLGGLLKFYSNVA